MAERQLIVVLPGIGGSVLARPDHPEDVVWDAEKRDIANLAFRPDRMSMEQAPHLTPLGLTESTKFMGFTIIPGYEKLLDQLEIFGKIDRHGDPEHPMPDADVVAVPYDFRRGIEEAAERLDAVVCAHLDGASEAERHKRVTIVAHSMGGLVARVWLGMPGRWPWCRTLITLGTPHRGAPKALNWLGLDGWERDFGDGTVPSFSALPPEMDDDEHSPVRLVQRHVPLAHAEIVTDLLNRPRVKAPPSQVHGPQDSLRPAAIGLDLDELYPARTPIRVTAALREVNADVSKQPVKARLRPVGARVAGQPGQVDVPLSWDAAQGCHTGELPGRPPGLYEVRVSAREVPNAGDLVTTDTVAVVDGE
ncbi:MAG: esterase/lipase family protein [Pseudonocardiaceae bacterium]